jgi:predicted naringenin-chalcone synthase
MRFINDIYTADFGRRWENKEVLAEFEPIIERLELDDETRGKLLSFVRFQLVGERSRRSVIEDWRSLKSFKSRADQFERGAEMALDRLAEQVAPAAENAGITFDAVLATTATGNLMPGLSYRMARRLGGLVRTDSTLIDLANVGCTGSIKALNLARSLDPSLKNILLVAVEVPSTLVDTTATDFDLWQGNCTFGDGAAALWVSPDPEQGTTALALEDTQYRQRADAGLNLIRWAYRDYYTFALEDHATFDQDVREYVVNALSEAEEGWRDEPRWAIHPAGILLLMKISRKLGIAGESIKPSANHYREYSNMSSASIVHILKGVAADAPAGAAINLLTMGAGFNVIYGRVRRVR